MREPIEELADLPEDLSQVINLTPHHILLVNKKGQSLRLPRAIQPVRLYSEDRMVGSLGGFPLIETHFTHLEHMPDPIEPGKLYIVSLLVAQYLKHPQFVSPYTRRGFVKRDLEGRTIAAKGFRRFAA